MVTIRLARGGAHKRPFFAIIVADRRRAPNGSNIERIGYYNPKAGANEEKLRIDMARFDYWVSKGAQPSDRIVTLIKQKAAADKATSAA